MKFFRQQGDYLVARNGTRLTPDALDQILYGELGDEDGVRYFLVSQSLTDQLQSRPELPGAPPKLRAEVVDIRRDELLAALLLQNGQPVPQQAT